MRLFAALFGFCIVQGLPAQDLPKGAATTTAPMISSGSFHSLAVDRNGKVYSWGSDANGQLGLGRKTFRTSPEQVQGLPQITSFSSLDNYVLAIDSYRRVWSWGFNACNRLGPREEVSESRPGLVRGLDNVVMVAAAWCYSLALRADGTVWGWGWIPGFGRDKSLRQLAGLTGIVEIAAGGFGQGAALARRGDGSVFVFEDKQAADLGALDAGLPPAAAIAASPSSLAALSRAGVVHGWGYAAGTGTITPSWRQLPDVGAPVSAISIAFDRIHAVRADGSVVSYDKDANAWSASVGTGFANLRSFAGSTESRAGIDRSGRLFVSGINDVGQLGLGDTTGRTEVVPVPGFERTASIGWGRSAFALKGDGTLWFWGRDTSGQSGDGSIVHTNYPQEVAIPASVVAACTGYFSYDSWALDSAGNAWHWGGPGLQATPQIAWGQGGMRAIACGSSGIASLTEKGTVHRAFGAAIEGFQDIVSIAMAGTAIFGLDSSGRVYASGPNRCGELGDGTTTARDAAVPVKGLAGVVTRISASDTRAGAVTSDGRAWSWQGNCSQPAGTVATAIPGVTDAVMISVSGQGELIALRDGTVLVRDPFGVNWLDTTRHASGLDAIAFEDGPPQSLTAGESFGHLFFLVGKSGMAWGVGYPSLSAMQTVGEYASLGDGVYVTRRKPVLLRAPGGRGSVDRNDWFLDLDASQPDVVPPGAVPKALALAQAFSVTDAFGLKARVQYRSADVGKAVNVYVLGLVPPTFFDLVKTAPDLAPREELAKRAKATGFVLALLTPAGWTNASGQLIALTQSTANAAGTAAGILNGVPISQLPGARFCIGYGESSSSLISTNAIAEVLRVDGATSDLGGVPCLLSGMYLEGPATAIAGATSTFSASVVGLSPSGTVQFRDGAANLLEPRPLEATSPATAKASLSTSALAIGVHSIGAAYSADPALVPAALRHEVVAAPAGTSVTTLSGPARSVFGEEVVFTTAVTGANPSGTVQLRAGGTSLGELVPLVGGAASLRIGTLSVGTHSVAAAYSGDGSNAASASSVLSHVVFQPTSPGVTLTSNATPAFVGTPATFTAVVAGDNPTGAVAFRDGEVLLGSVALAGGSASFTVTNLAAGLHLITAEYSGDARNTSMISSRLAYQVDPGATLAVSVTGNGSGRVISSPQRIDCGPTCSAGFTPGTSVSLTAMPAFGSTFSGWGGACSGQGGCTVALSADAGVTATFATAGGAGLASSAASLDFGGQSMRTTSPPQTITLTNGTAGAVTIGAITASAHFGVAHACATLAAGASCTLSVTFTPTSHGAIAGFIAADTSLGTHALALEGIGERSLATHYYRSILRRAPDAGGKQFWEGEAARLSALGANVNEAWYALAMNFFGSPEYLAVPRTPTELVRDMYNTFFNRAADDAGLAYWTSQMASGLSDDMVLTAFMFSAEFRSFAEAIFGNTAARAEVDMVVDFYRGLLGRLPDSEGFGFWLGVFRTAQCQGAGAVYAQVESISSAYMNSPEYVGRGRTGVQFIADMYNTFLRRSGDVSGVRYWVGEVESGARTRDDIRRQFIASPEFSARVQAVIAQGCTN